MIFITKEIRFSYINDVGDTIFIRVFLNFDGKMVGANVHKMSSDKIIKFIDNYNFL
ncbi:MAG: hypothetical protein ACOVNU_05885 [Candidatus Kapaibacteriota bacterium]